MPGMATNSGLEGVVVAETAISDVDGECGRLVIRGYEAETLADSLTFEETCFLLWSGTIPDSNERTVMRAKFGLARQAAFEVLSRFAPVAALHADAMDALRTYMSLFSGNTESMIVEYVRLSAAVGVFVGNWSRLRASGPLIPPDERASQSADILRMLGGAAQPDAYARALDTYLTTVSDHGMNASTFTCRVVASTASDNVSCLVAGIGALKGPLHGGAPGPVLKMLDEIRTPENAESWILNELNSGRRIMGMGHRIYRVRDPRAAIFQGALARLADADVPVPRLQLALAVEQTAERILRERYPDRQLKANVEFFTAVLLDAVGIPSELFTPTFAAGRVAGWCAHISEQRKSNRIIRPASTYVGGY